MLQNTSKTLAFKKIMVYKTPPGGGGRGCLAHGLYTILWEIQLRLACICRLSGISHEIIFKKELVEKPSETDSIQFKFSSRTFRGKKRQHKKTPP